ncbi:hypothetical protein [Mycoplasmoides pneumoniae]|uniref:Uncharacterized protein n=1 Tax=Mycoplasmoides pneumoniae TaxID=2104 RepID=A0AAP8JFS2_MYCPM|nr:hypothetical protein [Mycoplasmoides pneumoniae]AJR19055.1 hypothetical protein C985_01100 [Mycoplasmoides pneumoniae M129-B7]ALA30252.1 hypothetical protein C897_02130 [Mycoplasmoides pneumoniae PI 1428]ALA31201.1 hypothetical protein B434_03620 [Mycoplasmoides pneumoniae 19294]ALA31648.1 hypothetical protein F536_02095 [Mycoplasmoides pneumoniae 39443]ALA32360.1 hypothetical protein F533_02130 [Mycoplasmoides pneumoniae 51494]
MKTKLNALANENKAEIIVNAIGFQDGGWRDNDFLDRLEVKEDKVVSVAKTLLKKEDNKLVFRY